MATEQTTVYLPKQEVRRGTAGYKSGHGVKVVEVDPGSANAPATRAARASKPAGPKAEGEES